MSKELAYYDLLGRLVKAVEEIKGIVNYMNKGITRFSEAEVDFVFDKYFPELKDE